MTPEQEEKMLALMEKNHRMQRRILAAIIVPGIFVTAVGVFVSVLWIQATFFPGYYI